MAGGGKVRIIDRDSSSYDSTARVVNGRLLVDGGGGGGTSDVNLVSIGGVAVTTPLAVTGTVNVGNFPATVAVTQSTSPWVVSGTVAVSAVGGTVAVTQSTSPWVVSGTVSASIIGSVAISSVIPGIGTTNLGKQEDALHGSGDTGVAVWAVRNDAASALAGNGDYIPFSTDSSGSLRVNITGQTLSSVTTTVSSLTPGTSASNLGKAEDALAASGDVGVAALAVRRDAGGAGAADGDYVNLSTGANGSLRTELQDFSTGVGLSCIAVATGVADPVTGLSLMLPALSADPSYTNSQFNRPSVDLQGYLRVKVKGSPMSPIAFSGSTRGRPIQITATATAGTTIHTATTTSGEKDKIFVFLTNTSASAVTVTFEFGTTGAANNVVVQVPGNATVLAINGGILGGAATDTLAAFAGTGSVVNAFGYVERFAA